MKSCAVGAESTSRNAFGQESLSRELTRHDDDALRDGAVSFTATNTPGLTPETSTPKYPAASVVTPTAAPAVAGLTSDPRKQVGAVNACNVIGRFAAPFT